MCVVQGQFFILVHPCDTHTNSHTSHKHHTKQRFIQVHFFAHIHIHTRTNAYRHTHTQTHTCTYTLRPPVHMHRHTLRRETRAPGEMGGGVGWVGRLPFIWPFTAVLGCCTTQSARPVSPFSPWQRLNAKEILNVV